MRRHAEIPTIELVEELRLRGNVKETRLATGDKYKIESTRNDNTQYKFLVQDGPGIILVVQFEKDYQLNKDKEKTH